MSGFVGGVQTVLGTDSVVTATILDNEILDADIKSTEKGATKSIQVVAFDYTTDTAIGDGAAYFHVPASLAGYNIVAVHAEVITAGTTGTTDIQIANVTQAADILSTVITIDSTETGSDTAATPAVIDTAQDDLTENDVIRIDVDAVSTTAAKGLIVTLDLQLP